MSAAIETALFANEFGPWEYIIGEIQLNFVSTKLFSLYPVFSVGMLMREAYHQVKEIE